MSLFNPKKWGQRMSATRFEYSIHVHSLQPWPSGHKGIAMGWQRGKKRRGATNSVFPTPTPDSLGTVVRFNERFNVSATMYKVRAQARCAAGSRACCCWGWAWCVVHLMACCASLHIGHMPGNTAPCSPPPWGVPWRRPRALTRTTRWAPTRRSASSWR